MHRQGLADSQDLVIVPAERTPGPSVSGYGFRCVAVSEVWVGWAACGRLGQVGRMPPLAGPVVVP